MCTAFLVYCRTLLDESVPQNVLETDAPCIVRGFFLRRVFLHPANHKGTTKFHEQLRLSCFDRSRNNLNSCGFLVSGPDRNGSECIRQNRDRNGSSSSHAGRYPGVDQHTRVALISTHAWLHVAAARTRGCMPGRSTARDSCNPRPQWSSLGPRWTAATRASDRQLCTPGPRSTAALNHAPLACDGCLTTCLRWMAAPRARDRRSQRPPWSASARARDGQLQPGPAIYSSTRARDRRIQRLPRARCAWAEQQTAHISSHDDHARYDSRSCMLCKDRGLGTIRRAERSAAPGHAATRATATPAPARCASRWCRICMGGTGSADQTRCSARCCAVSS